LFLYNEKYQYRDVKKQAVGGRHDMPPSPASWQYFHTYSPGGTYSGMLAI